MKTTSLLTIVALLAFGSELRAADKPNILFVIADQWRAQAFGFAGDPNAQTPHLDALQRESIDCVKMISGIMPLPLTPVTFWRELGGWKR